MSKYVYLNKNQYIFRIDGKNIGRYRTRKEAEEARDNYFKGDRDFRKYGGDNWRNFVKEMDEHADYLTNQFKDGKLTAGEYFVSREGDDYIFIDLLSDDGNFGSYDDVNRVYMAVPSYSELLTCMFKGRIC